MSGMSNAELDALQRSHPSFEEELDGIERSALENYGLFGARMTANIFKEDLRSCLEAVARHDLLVNAALQGFTRSLAQASGPEDFALRLTQTIEFVKEEKRRTEGHD